jgi:hypothetical protein
LQKISSFSGDICADPENRKKRKLIKRNSGKLDRLSASKGFPLPNSLPDHPALNDDFGPTNPSEIPDQKCENITKRLDYLLT